MSSPSTAGRKLLAHTLSTRAVAATSHLTLILAAAATLAAVYWGLHSALTAERFALALGPDAVLPDEALPHFLSLAEDARLMFLERAKADMLFILMAAALAFAGAGVFRFVFSFVIDGLLVPRNEWGAMYLARESAVDRKVTRGLVISLTLLGAAGGWWLYGRVLGADPDAPPPSIPTAALLALIVVGLAVEYFVQSKWGFLSYLASTEVEFRDFARILAARFLTVCSFVGLMLGAVTALRHSAAPRLADSARAYHAALGRRAESFRAAAVEAGAGGRAVEDVVANMDGLRLRLREGVDGVVAALDGFEDEALRVVGFLTAGLLLVMVCFPITYREVRWAPLVYLLIGAALLASDFALRDHVSRLFRLDGPAPWPLAAWLLIALLGDAVGDILKRAFRREARCPGCGKANAWGAKHCSRCGRAFGDERPVLPPQVGALDGARDRRETVGAPARARPARTRSGGLIVWGALMFLTGLLMAGAVGRGRRAERAGRRAGRV